MEKWKKVIGSNGLFVSDLGRVKILDEESETVTCGKKTSDDYRRFGSWYVHRLVAEYFCEKKDGCNIVNHLNGIRHDNRAINLEWTTYEGNNRHAFESGIRITFGENHWKSCDKETVYRIYELKKSGKKVRDFKHLFPALTRKAIHEIFTGKNWRYEYEKVFGERFKKVGIAHGARSHNSIPEETVLIIYQRKKEGKRIFEIAKEVGFKFHTVKNIYHGINWRHLYKEHFGDML